MVRSRSRSASRSRDLSYDEYDLEARPRRRSRSRRRSSRRRRRDVEADAEPYAEEGLSTKAMVGWCAIGTGVLLLIVFLIAWNQDWLTPTPNQPPIQQQQQQQPPKPDPKKEKKEDSKKESSSSEDLVVPDPVNKPVVVKPPSYNDPKPDHYQHLEKLAGEIASLPVEKKSYPKVKEAINWIRKTSYWSLVFSKSANKHAWDLMKPSRAGLNDIKTHRKSFWSGDGNTRREEESWRNSVRGVYDRILGAATGSNATARDIDKALWMKTDSRALTLISNIYIFANDIRNKGISENLWWNERIRKTFWLFHGYYRGIELMRDVIEYDTTVNYRTLNDFTWVYRVRVDISAATGRETETVIDILSPAVRRKIDPTDPLHVETTLSRRRSNFDYLQAKLETLAPLSISRSDYAAVGSSAVVWAFFSTLAYFGTEGAGWTKLWTGLSYLAPAVILSVWMYKSRIWSKVKHFLNED